MNSKLVGVIAFVNEIEKSAMMVHIKNIPLNVQHPLWGTFCLGHNRPRQIAPNMRFST